MRAFIVREIRSILLFVTTSITTYSRYRLSRENAAASFVRAESELLLYPSLDGI